MIKFLLFDAANTLIYKPQVITAFYNVLKQAGYDLEKEDLIRVHKFISEVIYFPDRTSEAFYTSFNAEVLYALGILPEEKLLKDIFKSCTYSKWERFEDTTNLSEIDVPMGILSNFNTTLSAQIISLFGDKIFSHIISSEVLGICKPEIKFYERAVTTIDVLPENILYIGDSLKLDIVPAAKIGMKAYLIDRLNLYPKFNKRISSFNEIAALLAND